MGTFDKILTQCRSIGGLLSDVVFIGGVAVYLHARSARTLVPPEASHDADFMISLSDFGYLKDLEEVTSNPRLGKHQMFFEGVEFDVYVERGNHLVVPYDEVAAHAGDVGGLRLACLEHLLVLKLEALRHRSHSRKGDKDRRDVVQVGLMLGRGARRRLLDPYLRDDHLKFLVEISRGSLFHEICGKNAHAARKVREAFDDFAGTIADS
jgi:hypothetical protein